MTEIERKALALVNGIAGHDFVHPRDMKDKCWLLESLCRAIEQHEAFKREVSDAVLMYSPESRNPALARFILPKPDPLVEAWEAMLRDSEPGDDRIEVFRAAIKARGGKIVWEK